MSQSTLSPASITAQTNQTKVVSTDTKTNTPTLPLKIGSSFSGCGALDVAASNIGLSYSSEYIIEWDKYCVATYVENFPSVKKIFSDIIKVNPNEVPDVDLYVMSPPCVDFSSNGLQKGFKGTSGTLIFDALNIIKQSKVKPSYLIYENVKNLVGKKFKKSFDTILEALSELGYKNYWKLLDSQDFGVPQHRERVIIVSIRNDIDQTFEFPEDNSSDITSINDIMIPGEDYTKYLYHEPDIKKYITKRKSNLVKKFIIKRLKQSSDKIIYDTSGISPTLRTSCKAHFHDSKHNLRRYLTPKEKVAIQGFSQEFKWPVSKTQQLKMLGNTVSIPVYEAVLKALLPQYLPKNPKIVNKVPASINNTSTSVHKTSKTKATKSSKLTCISLLQTIKQKEGYISGPIITTGIKSIQKKATDKANIIIEQHISENHMFLAKTAFINKSLIQYSKDQDIFDKIEGMDTRELTTFLKDRNSTILNVDSFADNSNTKKLVLFPYAGGKQGVNKSKMQSLVSDAFKTKKYTKFIDTFAGGLGATYNALPVLLENGVEEIVVNDINKSIINVYRQIQRNPKQVQRKLTSISIDYYKEFGKFAPETREEARAQHIILEAEFKELEIQKKMSPRRAALFLYLMHKSTGGMLDYDMETKTSFFETSYKIINIDLLINKVQLFHKIFTSTKMTFKSVQYQTIFKTYKNDTDAIVLIDPPYIEYQEVEATTKGCSFTYGIDFNQQELLNKVKRLSDFIYYNNHNPLVEDFATKNSFSYSKNNRTYSNGVMVGINKSSTEICMTKFTPAESIKYTTANNNLDVGQAA